MPRYVAFEATTLYLATVAFARGHELAVGPLRVRAGHGHVVATINGFTSVREGFPDDAAAQLIEATRGSDHGEGHLLRAIRDVAPDLIPVPPASAGLAALRAVVATAEAQGRHGDSRRAQDDLDEAEACQRRAEAIGRLLADLDGEDAVADTDRAPETVRRSLRSTC